MSIANKVVLGLVIIVGIGVVAVTQAPKIEKIR